MGLDRKKDRVKLSRKARIGYGIYYVFMVGICLACFANGFDLRVFLWIYLLLLLILLMSSNHLAISGESSRSYYMDRLNIDLGPRQIFPFRHFVLTSIPAVFDLVLYYMFK